MDIFTIGHSTLKLNEFLELLRKYNVNCIVDVRSIPYSKFATAYNRENIKIFLKENTIKYIHMGKEFGARRTDKKLYDNEGYLDFEKARNDDEFIIGMERIKKGIKYGYNIALMCSEKDPIDCHRTIMVSKGLNNFNINTYHILPKGNIITQEEIEDELLNKYYPNRNQLSFDIIMGNSLTNEEMIEEAYRKRNKEIGFQYIENGDV